MQSATAPATVIYRIPVAGWQDKYISMPEGAYQDISNLISQGMPQYLTGDISQESDINTNLTWKADGSNSTTGASWVDGSWNSNTPREPVKPVTPPSGELVGRYKDDGAVTYTQQNSDFVAADFAAAVVGYDSSSDTQNNTPIDKVDDPPNGKTDVPSGEADLGAANWKVAYKPVSGTRTFEVAGTPTDSMKRDPNWFWEVANKNFAANENQSYYVSSTNGRFTDNVIAYDTYVDVLKTTGDTATIVKTGSTSRPNQVAATFNYWEGWVQDSGSQSDDNIMGSGSHSNGWDNHDWTAPTAADKAQGNWTTTDSNGKSQTRNWSGWAAAAKDEWQVKSHSSTHAWFYVDWYIRGRDLLSHDILQTKNNYDYTWTSQWHPIYDQRIQLGYKLVTNEQQEYDYRAVFATKTVQVPITKFKDVTVWEKQAVISDATKTVTERTFVDGGLERNPFAVAGASLSGLEISIDSGKNVSVTGLLQATNNLTLNAATLLDLGVDAATQSTLNSTAGTVSLSGDNVSLSDALTVNGNAIELNASRDMALGGVQVLEQPTDKTLKKGTLILNSQTTITALAGRNITLSGVATATNQIIISAGDTTAKLQSTSASGSITGDLETALKVTSATGTVNDISLSAGEFGGNITLAKSVITTPLSAINTTLHNVKLTAKSGKISQTEGMITTDILTANADRGLKLNTSINSLTAQLTAAGSIALLNNKDLTLTKVIAFDGAITVDVLGSVVATDVEANGGTDGNDITINTIKTDTAVPVNLTMTKILTDSRGDITLNIQGSILQVGSPLLTADVLNVTVADAITLNTSVNKIRLQTTKIGNVSIIQDATDTTKDLVLERVHINDGSLTVTADGKVDLADVLSETNKEINDITVTAAGDIAVRYVNAGIYLDAGVNTLPATSTVLNGVETITATTSPTSVSSAGDIFLTSTAGNIHETFLDDAPDVMADELTISAATGIVKLQVAINTLDATSTAGDITVSDVDGNLEKFQGLLVKQVIAATSGTTVTLTANNSLNVGLYASAGTGAMPAVDGKVTGGTIRLISTNESVVVAKRSNSTSYLNDTNPALNYTSGIGFNAKKLVDLYKVFVLNTPVLIEYRAGGDFIFRNDDTTNLVTGRQSQLPKDLTSETIIIETGSLLSINGTLTASKHLELVSGVDVIVRGNILAGSGTKVVGAIDEVIIKAKGTNTLTTTVDKMNLTTGAMVTNTITTSGNVNIQTTGIAASNFEIRAKNDIFIGLKWDFTLTGFIGGLANFDPAANVTLHIGETFDSTGVKTTVFDKTLTVQGGIVAAKQNLELRAQTVTTDTSSVFIGTNLNSNLDVVATGGISLNTLVANVSAVSSSSGNIIINEADNLNVNNVLANDGKIEITAGGNMFAKTVQITTDKLLNDITLKSAIALKIDNIEAGVNNGADKTASEVILDAAGGITEMGSGDDGVDVFGYKVTFKGAVITTRIQIASDKGTQGATDVEYKYSAPEGTGMLGGTGQTAIPSTVKTIADAPSIDPNKDYILIVPTDGTGTAPATLTATGTLSIVSLPAYTTGSVVSLSAGTGLTNDLVIVSDITAAGQTVNLTAGGGITLGGKVTAGSLVVSAGTASGSDLTLKTDVDNLSVTMSGAGNLVVQQSGIGNLNVTSLTMHGGDVSFILDSGSITFGALSGTTGTISIVTKSGSIILPTSSALFSAGAVILSGTGSITGALDADSLDLTANGEINITDKDGVIVNSVVNGSTVNSVFIPNTSPFSLTTGGATTLNASLSTATSPIDLITTAGLLTVNQSLTSTTGAVTLNAVGGITLSAETKITTSGITTSGTTSSGNVVFNSASGAITMSDETIVNAGYGLISLNASGIITLGKLATTNANPFEITSTAGAVLDAGDSPVDIYAPNAKLVVRSVGGIGTTAGKGGAIEILVKELDVINTGGGDIAFEHVDDATNSSGVLLDEVHGLTIRRIENLGATAGAITVRTTDDTIILDGNIISGSTDKTKIVTLYAGDAYANTTATKVNLIGGIQTAGAGVEVTAENGDITFTNYEITNPNTLVKIANTLTKGIEVLGSGDIKLTATQGSIVNNENLANVEALFPATTGVNLSSSLLLPAVNISGYASDNPDLDWAIAKGEFDAVTNITGKFVVDATTQQMKLSGLTTDEIMQHNLKNGEVIGWKVTGTSTWKAFNPRIDWALQNKKFSATQATGAITFGTTLAAYEKIIYQLDDNVVIRNAEGAYIQTTGGGLTMTAKNTIGQPVAGFKYSPLSLFIDAKTLLVNSTERDTSSLISTGAIEIKSTSSTGSAAGKTELLSLSSSTLDVQKVANPVDAAGEDITLISDNIDLSAPVRSAGATIILHPIDETRDIIIGGGSTSVAGAYQIDTTEFANLKDGFGQIVIGSEVSSGTITIGDGAVGGNLAFNDSISINSPALGGEIWIKDNMVGAKGADFVINGSGHTTTLSANVTVKSNVDINDSMKISGARLISTTQGDIILGGKSAHFLSGDNVQGDDTLTLRAATGDIIVNEKIGGSDALEGLSITKAKNVSFNNEVKIDGNLSINASGIVAFNSSLDISGQLTIRGAKEIMLGDKTFETNGKTVILKNGQFDSSLLRSTEVVKSLENTVNYYDKADNDIFYFWTENVRL